MTPNKRHHWVPDSYLRAWFDPQAPGRNPFVHIFNKDGSDHRRKSPKKIMRMSDLYTVFRGGERDLHIERYFSQIEKDFVRVRSLAATGKLTAMGDVMTLYQFASALLVRPPHKTSFLTKQFSGIADKARSIRIDPNAKPIPSLTSGPRITIDEMQRMADDPMGTWFPTSLATHFRVVATMFGCDLLVNESPYPFVTSDSPATVSFPETEQSWEGVQWPHGLGARGCVIYLPISPTQALRFTHKPPGFHERIALDWEGVFEVNCATITRAKQTIVADREDLFFVQAILDRIKAVEGVPFA